MDLDSVAKQAASGSLSRRGMLRKLFGGALFGLGGVAALQGVAGAAPGGGGSGGGGGKITCPPGMLACGTSCRDGNADPTNCGTCGTVCHDWEICRGGSCVPLCPTGFIVCGGACVDATTHAVCNGTCVTTSTDPNNCGSCGHVCAPGTTCVNGVCAACPAGQTQCNGVCVNTQNDVNNCGTCGGVCAAPSICQTAAVCQTGVCTYSNATAGTACGQTCANATVTSYQCDGTGSCTAASTTSCGNYACNSGGTACNSTCSANSDCNTGFVCSGSVCVAA